MKTINFIFLVCILGFLLFSSCKRQEIPDINDSQKLIIVVVDGARYSETWGEATRQYIPHLSEQIGPTGVLYTNFYNNEFTYTLSGHTSIVTGNYQSINNSGEEWPQFPSIFQYLNKQHQKSEKAWIIASKDKLEVLSHCQLNPMLNLYSPRFDVGISGLGSGYRHDSITFNRTMDILSNNNPNLVLISFREPDYSAHQNNWKGYIEGIKNTDQYIYKIWEFIQNDPIYSDKTTLIVTNDHGRHLDNVADGFISHGDTCMGCRHISFFICGPNIKKGVEVKTYREIIDISATVAKILDFSFESGNGKVMDEIFIEK
jgi:predicted AlkP superfamily pyrophosphatase or phosphodiesterase